MAGKLVSMKISAAEQKKMMEPTSMVEDRARYPYGLQLNLDTAALEKLGIADDLPEVGESYVLVAKVDVTSVSSNKHEGGSSQSLSLQITEMCLEDGDATDAAKALYS